MFNEGELPSYEGDTPEKGSDQQYHYAFSDWEPSLTAIAEDTDYSAKFTGELNQYTVTFKNYDGAVLGFDTVDYGTSASYKGDTPERPRTPEHTYTFKGWDVPLDVITENVNAIAQYDEFVNQYTVTFKNWDGTVLGSDTVDYGTAASYKGETPEKPKTQQYTFAFKGWDIPLDSITEDVVATAQFSNTTNKYTVTFKNYDGSVLGSDTVDYGTSATYKWALPTKPDSEGDCGHRFIGWNHDISNVQANLVVTAQFEAFLKNATYSLNSDSNGYVLSLYSGNSAFVRVPGTYYGLPVLSIGGGAFQNNKDLISIEIEDPIESLGNSSFSGCSNLKRIRFSPSSHLKTVEGETFKGTDALFRKHHYASSDYTGYITHLNVVFPKNVHFVNNSVFFTNVNCSNPNLGIIFYGQPGDFQNVEEQGIWGEYSTSIRYYDPSYYSEKWVKPKMQYVNVFTIDDITEYGDDIILVRDGSYNLVHDTAECCGS